MSVGITDHFLKRHDAFNNQPVTQGQKGQPDPLCMVKNTSVIVLVL